MARRVRGQGPREIQFLFYLVNSRAGGNPVLSLDFRLPLVSKSQGFPSSCGGAGNSFLYSCKEKSHQKRKHVVCAPGLTFGKLQRLRRWLLRVRRGRVAASAAADKSVRRVEHQPSCWFASTELLDGSERSGDSALHWEGARHCRRESVFPWRLRF